MGLNGDLMGDLMDLLGSALRIVIYFLAFFSGIVYSLSGPEDQSSNASCPTTEFIHPCHSRQGTL